MDLKDHNEYHQSIKPSVRSLYMWGPMWQPRSNTPATPASLWHFTALCSTWSSLNCRFYLLHRSCELWRAAATPVILISQCLAQCLAQMDEPNKMLNDWMNQSITSLLIPHRPLYSWQPPNCHFNLCFLSLPTRSKYNLTLRAVLGSLKSPGHFIVRPATHFSQLSAPSCIQELDGLLTEPLGSLLNQVEGPQWFWGIYGHPPTIHGIL